MKLLSILVTASFISMVAASQLSNHLPLHQRAIEQHILHKRSTLHSKLPRLLQKRGSHRRRSKDCSQRKKKTSSQSQASGTSSGDTNGSESSSGSDDKSGSSSTSSNNNNSSSGTTSTKSSGKTNGSSSKGASAAKSTSNSSSPGKGIAGMTFSGKCKDPKVSDDCPNGDISFLNCGISKYDKKSKWSPPDIQMKDIQMISSNQAVKSNVFKPCSKYQADFEKAEEETGIPVVMLMAFAMQESTCNSKETGGNGERGMMQLTPDKCKGVDCYDASTNIMLGAKYFQSQVKEFNGNVLEAVGAYNGWSTDMSFSSATNLQWGCAAQNNLDYLDAFFNGWIQGKDGYSKQFRIYDNLANCSN